LRHEGSLLDATRYDGRHGGCEASHDMFRDPVVHGSVRWLMQDVDELALVRLGADVADGCPQRSDRVLG
jgi:hypothetical protein